ncbi:MAG TPA: hypothetical protein VKH19_03975 [Gemmatimonadaceae bacterium]|nr:hypothetical protein [Gemmatimonadaceae bacterium]
MLKISLHPMLTGQMRSLFLISAEHGELALAEMFVRASTVMGEWRILLPPKLFGIHKDAFGGRAAQYTSLGDVTRAIEEVDPQIVVLCSAYLLSLDNLLAPREVRELLALLRARGCAIATTDPFLGLASVLTPKDVDIRYLLPGLPSWKRALAGLARAVVGARTKLIKVPPMDDLAHIYPTGIPERPDGIWRLSFAPPSAPSSVDASATGTPPQWLFVLAEIDMHTQLVEMELRDFVENLLGMLRFAVAQGARPVLIAPRLIVDRLAGATTSEMELHEHLPLTEFRTRAMDAEYVFYWNAFSLSQLERLSSERPVFVFDRGYLSRAVAPYHEVATTCHFGGWEPKYLDQRQLFSPYVLAHLAKQQRSAVHTIAERWRQSPTSDEMLRQLLATADRSRSG